MPGARNVPAASRAIEKKHASVVTTVTPESPGIPRATVLTVSFELSPVSRAFLPPSFAQDALRKLDISVGISGPHDFAVRETRARQARDPRPSHPAPNVRDDRETPLVMRRGTAIPLLLFLPMREAKYFSPRGWTGRANQCVARALEMPTEYREPARSPHERSDMRGRQTAAPDVAFAHPGYPANPPSRSLARRIALTEARSAVSKRHPEVRALCAPRRMPGTNGGPVVLRGSLRSHLRMTGEKQAQATSSV
jgi:hypothetical protein